MASQGRTTSLTIDFAAGLRRIKPEKQPARLSPRPPEELVAAADLAGDGRAAIVLDTNVYIQSAAGTPSAAAATLVDRGLLFHCSVCVSELATGVAAFQPDARSMEGASRLLQRFDHDLPADEVADP